LLLNLEFRVNKNIKYWIFLLFLTSCLSAFAAKDPIPLVRNGILDLRNCKIEEKTIIKLNGGWEFYWNRLLDPSDFSDSIEPEPDCIGRVPSYWTSYEGKGGPYPGKGNATYRLRILFPPDFDRNIMFDVPVFDAAFNLFVDGIYLGGNGKPSASAENSEAEYLPFLTIYTGRNDTLDVIIQVSNYQHRRGGFWKPMRIGSREKLVRLNNQYKLISFVSLGVLLSFSLFFMFFFIFHRKERKSLFFSIMLAGILFRLSATDIYPMLLFTDMPWRCMIRIEYLGSFLAFVVGMWYFYLLYPNKIMHLLTRINTLIIVIISVIVLITDVDIFSFTMLYFQPAVLLFLLYYIFAAGRKAIKGIWVDILFLSAILFFIVALINDILIANSQTAVTKGYTIHFAVQLFVFVQAIMIIRDWINAFVEKEKLHKEIEFINRNLEELVTSRTAELNEKNIDLQNALKFKDRVFSIIAHDLKSPVASLVQNTETLNLNLSNEKRKEILVSFRRLAQSAADLIDNLLYWGLGQGNQLQYKPEICNIGDILATLFSFFNEQASQKSVSLVYQPEEDSTVFCDPELIQIVMRNLISNALKYSNPGGIIRISAFSDPDNQDWMKIRVEDEGIGIPDNKLTTLFTSEEIVSTPGTAKEKGTGLGLRLCHDLIQISNGKIEVKSSVGKGSAFTITLPKRKLK